MVLPHDFTALSAQEQLFVLFDLERVARGLDPIAGLAATLDARAQIAAAHNADPGFPITAPGYAGGGSVWAGDINTLTATYGWMYDDGWAGATTTNGDCTSPTAPGCWGHRDAILEPGAYLAMGAGYVANGWIAGEYSSYTGLIVRYTSPTDLPPLSYTWADAVAAGAGA